MVGATVLSERDAYSPKVRQLADEEEMSSQNELQAVCSDNELDLEVPKSVVLPRRAG